MQRLNPTPPKVKKKVAARWGRTFGLCTFQCFRDRPSEALRLMRKRQNQKEAHARAELVVRGEADCKITVCESVPGSGKSLIGAIFQNVMVLSGFVERVFVLTPSKTLRDQMYETLSETRFGIGLPAFATKSAFDLPRLGDRVAVVSTYQAKKTIESMLEAARAGVDFLLILDEFHHLSEAEKSAWRKITEELVKLAKHVVVLSGTLYRSDMTRFPFLPKEPDGSPRRHIVYGRKLALQEHAIIPVTFQLYDGETKWEERGEEEFTLLSEADEDKVGGSIKTACAITLDLGREILTRGMTSWFDYRDHYYKSQVIIVCYDQAHAKQVSAHIKKAWPGNEVALAINDEKDDAHIALAKFRTRKGPDILVTCKMAYEGLDAPAVTHMILLCRTRSRQVLEQTIARACRVNYDCGLPWESQAAVIFAPGDKAMRQFAATVNEEQGREFREAADRLTSPREGQPRRSTFVALDSTVTSVAAGGDGGFPEERVQKDVRRLLDLYPWMSNAPLASIIELAGTIDFQKLTPPGA